MATIVDSFPADHSSRAGGSNAKYDWATWTRLDENGVGRIIQITRGEDFDITARRMRMSVASRASAQGLRAKTAVRGDSVIFQFRAPEAQGEAPARARALQVLRSLPAGQPLPTISNLALTAGCGKAAAAKALEMHGRAQGAA